jgi:hypothetical protein
VVVDILWRVIYFKRGEQRPQNQGLQGEQNSTYGHNSTKIAEVLPKRDAFILHYMVRRYKNYIHTLKNLSLQLKYCV